MGSSKSRQVVKIDAKAAPLSVGWKQYSWIFLPLLRGQKVSPQSSDTQFIPLSPKKNTSFGSTGDEWICETLPTSFFGAFAYATS